MRFPTDEISKFFSEIRRLGVDVGERNLIKTNEEIKSMHIDESIIKALKLCKRVSYSEGEIFHGKSPSV